MDTEKQAFLRNDDSSSDSVQNCCHGCRQHTSPRQKLRYWLTTLLAHALILLTTLALLVHLLKNTNLLDSPAIPSQDSSSPSLYCMLQNFSTRSVFTLISMPQRQYKVQFSMKRSGTGPMPGRTVFILATPRTNQTPRGMGSWHVRV